MSLHHRKGHHWPEVLGGWAAVVVLAGSGTWWAVSRGDADTLSNRAASNSTFVAPVTLLDVAYATASPSQTLDLFLPTTDGSRAVPLVVLVHGGGFYSGDKQELTDPAKALVDAGFAVASLNYRLTAEARFPAAAQDVKAAVRWLRANAATYQIDPDRFGAWGQSAGGWLVAMLGVTGDQTTVFDDPTLGNPEVSSAVQAVAAWYGVYDFATETAQAAQIAACATVFVPHIGLRSFESYWLGDYSATSPLIATANLTAYVATAGSLPTWYLAHGDADCVVPYLQSVELRSALAANGATVTLIVLPGQPHPTTAVDDTQTAPTIAFLAEALGLN